VDLQKSRDVREVSQKILKVCRDIRRPSNLGGRCRLKLNKRLSDISGYMSTYGTSLMAFSIHGLTIRKSYLWQNA